MGFRKFYSDPLLVVEDIKKANSIVGVDNISNTSSAFLPVRLAGRNVFRLPTITKNDNMIDTIQREKEIVGYDNIYNEGYYIYGWKYRDWETFICFMIKILGFNPENNQTTNNQCNCDHKWTK